jgi:hypothetical protein
VPIIVVATALRQIATSMIACGKQAGLAVTNPESCPAAACVGLGSAYSPQSTGIAPNIEFGRLEQRSHTASCCFMIADFASCRLHETAARG